MKNTFISVSVAFAVAVLVYIAMLVFATGLYVETVGNIIVLSSLGAGVTTAVALRLRARRRPA